MRKPYHDGNINLTPYAPWRVKTLAWVAFFLRVQFKIRCMPFGGPDADMLYDKPTDELSGAWVPK